MAEHDYVKRLQDLKGHITDAEGRPLSWEVIEFDCTCGPRIERGCPADHGPLCILQDRLQWSSSGYAVQIGNLISSVRYWLGRLVR